MIRKLVLGHVPSQIVTKTMLWQNRPEEEREFWVHQSTLLLGRELLESRANETGSDRLGGGSTDWTLQTQPLPTLDGVFSFH